MTSYKLMIKDVIKQADILLEILDARFPEETRNSEIERDVARAKKPLIIVVNKCDLVSREELEETKSRLSKIAPTVYVSGKDGFGKTMLRRMILETACIKGRDLLVGTLGYPNTGKSSVINAVSGRHSAGTSSISGHTKGVQLVNAGSRIKFIDTPGVIPFGENDQYMQGILGIKSASHLEDPIGVALKIIEKIHSQNKTALESFYHITIGGQDLYDVFLLIGRECNFIQKKGAIDESRTAMKIIDDWQKGALMNVP